MCRSLKMLPQTVFPQGRANDTGNIFYLFVWFGLLAVSSYDAYVPNAKKVTNEIT